MAKKRKSRFLSTVMSLVVIAATIAFLYVLTLQAFQPTSMQYKGESSNLNEFEPEDEVFSLFTANGSWHIAGSDWKIGVISEADSELEDDLLRFAHVEPSSVSDDEQRLIETLQQLGAKTQQIASDLQLLNIDLNPVEIRVGLGITDSKSWIVAGEVSYNENGKTKTLRLTRSNSNDNQNIERLIELPGEPVPVLTRFDSKSRPFAELYPSFPLTDPVLQKIIKTSKRFEMVNSEIGNRLIVVQTQAGVFSIKEMGIRGGFLLVSRN